MVSFSPTYVLCFGVCAFEQIEYEPFFKYMLVSNAISDYMAREWKVTADELIYSDAYQKAFFEHRSLDLDKMTPELLCYMHREPADAELDFYSWKEKRLQPFLNYVIGK